MTTTETIDGADPAAAADPWMDAGVHALPPVMMTAAVIAHEVMSERTGSMAAVVPLRKEG